MQRSVSNSSQRNAPAAFALRSRYLKGNNHDYIATPYSKTAGRIHSGHLLMRNGINRTENKKASQCEAFLLIFY